MNPEALTKRIAQLIFEKKGSDVKIIDIYKVSTLTDYFILCTCDSDTQVKAVSDHIEKTLRDEAVKVWHKEGYQALQWVLLDYVDVVVHIFARDTRAFYNLERLWADAPITDMIDDIPAISSVKKSKAEK